MNIDYSEKIPNNVNLSNDRRLQRALERWQPEYLNWWNDLGPDKGKELEVYLRTAISVEKEGWAHFDFVRMPEYRWGIFLSPAEENRKIGFGQHLGEDAWQEVPGEYRGELRRLIVTQGDTEPASVEQQRLLGHTCPSLYDLRNLFQVNVEEGRHLWAMVYLLHAYFGRDGREEAEEILERHSGILISQEFCRHSMKKLRTGCLFSCSHTSPTEMGSSSWPRWRSRVLILFHEPADSC